MPKPSISLAQQAVTRITAMIRTEGRYRPGDKLPNEMELSEELGISRITLREAIKILCTRGLLEVRRGRGTFVVSELPPEGEESGVPAVEFTDASPGELLEAYLVLEPAAAGQAAKYATDEALRALDALYLRMEKRAAMGRDLLREEQAFHDGLAAACQNRVLSRTLSLLNDALYREGSGLKENAAFTLQDHRELLRCLKERSPDGARAASLLHILHVFQSSGVEIE